MPAMSSADIVANRKMATALSCTIVVALSRKVKIPSRSLQLPATADEEASALALPMASSSNPKPRPKRFHEITSTYVARYGKRNDQTKVTDEERLVRQRTAAEGVDQYYDFATSAYLNGWSTHFHYTPFAPHDTILSAMHFYEHRFALLMGLRPGMKVLDVGCGVGGPAREIAKIIGCEIVGITINQRQVDHAIRMTAEAGLGHLCTFMKGDFLKLHEHFAPGSFDAAYAIEATVHAPSLKEVYTSITKMLKPGAVFGLSEWVMTPNFDPNNNAHIAIRNKIERGNSLSNMQTSDQCREAMLHAGFKLYHDEDFANHWDLLSRPEQPSSPSFSSVAIPIPTNSTSSSSGEPSLAPPPSRPLHLHPPLLRPWYFPLAGHHHLATTYTDWWIAFRMSHYPRLISYWLIYILEKLHLYPRGVIAAMDTMADCVDSVVEGARAEVFTPCWWFIGRTEGED